MATTGESGHAEAASETVPGDELYEDDGLESSPSSSGGSWLTGRTLVRMAIAGLVLLAGLVLVVSYVQGPATPSDNSAAAGLARDMIDHHAQAVDMATIVQRRTQDDDVRYLTTDMALTQSSQMGQMQGWLNLWGLTIGRTGQPMQWMQGHEAEHELSGISADDTHVDENGLMPGMATQKQVNELRSLPTKQADILFLQLMIKHHQGGVAMARAALQLTDEPVVVNLCKTIVKGQQAEIALMQNMLSERGAQP
ncbi:DUF305 domain-containing protein [Kineosporia sp. NBRC 101731]|uniref:DUF305 domain-containing protein n=1 Tax=Kineosporia sp. NBRC 101731 TaxID=3032199 RepID=UPI0024A4BA75|nr:DUF305 domain-containing protein [Kineosporia sp. NBRC 101731]GLY31359.1 hypothetical protein Kisp02_47240 [Kineosporia sp. NBRC 101731]